MMSGALSEQLHEQHQQGRACPASESADGNHRKHITRQEAALSLIESISSRALLTSPTSSRRSFRRAQTSRTLSCPGFRGPDLHQAAGRTNRDDLAAA